MITNKITYNKTSNEKRKVIDQMKASTKKEAWEIVNTIISTDLIKDDKLSAQAGYPVYTFKVSKLNGTVSDLGDELLINFSTGRTIDIRVSCSRRFEEYEIEDALRTINNAIYEIDDKVERTLSRITGIDKARNILCDAFDVISEILSEQHPDSRLFNVFNLKHD